MPPAAVAETEPLAATLTAVLSLRETPVSENGSVIRVPGVPWLPWVRVRGWLVVVELAFWEPMVRAVQRLVLP